MCVTVSTGGVCSVFDDQCEHRIFTPYVWCMSIIVLPEQCLKEDRFTRLFDLSINTCNPMK